MSNLDKLREASSTKEKELREVLELRVETLEVELATVRQNLSDETSKLNELKNDFKHNFRLLQEKEDSLKETIARLNDLENSSTKLQIEMSNVSLDNEKLRHQLAQEQDNNSELRSFFSQKLEQNQAEFSSMRKERELAHKEEIESLMKAKKQLLKDLAHAEENLLAQKEELINKHCAEIEEINSKWEKKYSEEEHKLFSLEVERDLHVSDLKTLSSAASSLENELSSKDMALKTAFKDTRDLKLALEEAEKLFKAKLADRDMQIEELLEKIDSTEKESNRCQVDLEFKLRAKTENVERLKEANEDLKCQIGDQKRDFGLHLQQKDAELVKLQNRFESDLLKKDSLYEQACDEKRTIKQQLELAILDKERLAKSLADESTLCKEKIDRLKYDLRMRNEDVERYRKDLAESVESHRSLERELEQKDIDWGRKCELIESTAYEKSEMLVKSLTEQRSRLSAEIVEIKRSLNSKEQLVALLKRERDASVLTLRRHHLSVDFDIPIQDNQTGLKLDQFQSAEFEKMVEQNNSLREVVKSMRDEMELHSKEVETKHSKVVDGFVLKLNDLENVVKEKEDQIKQLENELREVSSNVKSENLKTQKSDPEKPTQTSHQNDPAQSTVKLNLSDQQILDMQYELISLKRQSASQMRQLHSKLQQASSQIVQLTNDKQKLIEQIKSHGNLQKGQNEKLGPREAEYIMDLHGKLKAAAKHIRFLASERQRLIALCNKLKSTGKVLQQEDMTAFESESSGGKSKQVKVSKLDQIQELQYQLARQQLADLTRVKTDKSIEITDDDNMRPRRPRTPVQNAPTVSQPKGNQSVSEDSSSSKVATPIDQSETAIGVQDESSTMFNIMSSVGGNDSTLENIIKMVDGGPEIFSPLATSWNTQEAPNLDPSSNNQALEVVGVQGPVLQSRAKSQTPLSLKAQGRIRSANVRNRTVRNYNNKSDE